MNKSKGFTLAEVLVTLAVIGVVGALTIPAIINNSEEAGIVSKVLKYDSVLNQAFNHYAVDKGCVGNLACTGAFGPPSGSWHEHLGNEIKPYLNVVKDCGIATGTGECFPAGVMYKRLNGDDNAIVDDQGISKMLLADGSIIGFIADTDGAPDVCTRNEGSGPLSEICGHVVVDVNGHKGPNQKGRDYFLWWLTKDGVYPTGILDDSSGNTCEPATDTGHGCTAKVIKERAINY